MEEQIYEASVEEKTLFSTEFEFTLPKGFIDEEGSVHRDGIMRLANARDEIAPLSDPKVRENKAYLVILILSRVITKLGNISEVTPEVVERFFSADLSYFSPEMGEILVGRNAKRPTFLGTDPPSLSTS